MGKIFKSGEFDIDALRKARANNKTAPTDLAAALRGIAPEVEKLLTGQVAQIETNKTDLRKTVMQITAKLNHLTARGGDWAGKQFDVVSDGETNVYVQRGKNIPADEAPIRRKGGGGRGKGKNTANASEGTQEPAQGDAGDNSPADTVAAGDTVTAQSGALVREHS